MDDERFVPRRYRGVMVSSTFADLKQHRAALVQALENQGLYAIAMERDAALPDSTVIDSSLQKVRDAAAYIGVIGYKYGEIPHSTEKNPSGFSLTELEFREARRLGRPMLIFIMGEDHAVKVSGVEQDPEKIRKLGEFRQDMKQVAAESRIQRVYKEFNNLHEFELAATQSIAQLQRLLEAKREIIDAGTDSVDVDDIPRPPNLYAEPRYIGSHAFVGRAAELETLSGWAASADSYPMLLFEAIGGAGKSMLTWEWTVSHANSVRPDWAGIFWYSFYEKGAVMADFCQRALAYMTGQRLDVLRETGSYELTRQLLRQLQSRPWLLILDGLERVLAAYHRYDAAQLADDEVVFSDETGSRDPTAAIRFEDDELLRRLTDATPSKILITSRLVPRSLLNQASCPIPGVRHERLAGLRPADAEALVRAGGVHGDSRMIQTYLKLHCDCHPLVTGIVVGLVLEYLPARGHFDAWADDSVHGGQLNLAKLNLVQKRNHILKVALIALPVRSRQLLSMLAFLSEAVDYNTLIALNPDLPSQYQPVSEPVRLWAWRLLPVARWRPAMRKATSKSDRPPSFESPEDPMAIRELAFTVRDLERRGLLQYDRQADRYDLHPVVRGFVAGNLLAEERDQFGQRVVNYLSQQAKGSYERAETSGDVGNGMQVVRTLFQIGRAKDAINEYSGELENALLFNLEANIEILSLLRPLFGREWTAPSSGIDNFDFAHFANAAAFALYNLGQLEESLNVYKAALQVDLDSGNWSGLYADLINMAAALARQNHLAEQDRCIRIGLELAELMDESAFLFRANLDRYLQLTELGRWEEALAVWQTLDPMGRDWPRAFYRPGDAEVAYARSEFRQGRLTEHLLASVEQWVRYGRDRALARTLHVLRGEWHLDRREWAPAAESLHEAIRMARETGLDEGPLEARLALALFQLDRLSDARQQAIRLSRCDGSAQLAVAELWCAIGDTEKSAEHATAACQWAWADGEPFVHRYELIRAMRLLDYLGAEISLPARDPVQGEPFVFEHQIRVAMEALRAERRAGAARLISRRPRRRWGLGRG